MTRTLRLTSAVAAAGLVLAGCSGTDEQPDSPAETTEASPVEADASPAADPDNAAQADIDPSNPPEPIATTEMPATTAEDGATTMRVDLLGLKREDKLLVATFGFTPEEGEGRSQWHYGWLGDKGWSPQIVDGTNLKVHDVVAGSQVGRLMTAYQGTKFGPGQTYYAFATFAAPPSGASLTVKAADGAPPFTGVTAP